MTATTALRSVAPVSPALPVDSPTHEEKRAGRRRRVRNPLTPIVKYLRRAPRESLATLGRPVEQPTRTYRAEFSDISGLRINGDVRTKGVRIGKITDTRIVRVDGRSVAEVDFTLDESYRLTENSRLTVKYQNLTGARYVDVAFGPAGRPVDTVPLSRTTGSFDITELFNGLQPVLATMRTDEVNEFTDNALAILQGDGSGLAPMLDNVAKLSRFATDRERLISTLTANMARIADTMGGRTPEVMEFLHSVKIPVAKGMTVLEEFYKTDRYGPAFTEPIDRLMGNLGLRPGLDVDKLLTDAFSSIPQAAEALRMIPVAVAGLQVPAGIDHSGRSCANGLADLPSDVELLLDGSEVVVCAAG
ncbi:MULTISPECIES: MlaD family protein [Gordonia]|uniref:MlaD family protein n=1 Tax=Gordonia amicalis TaxID=89053 RepID=A0AAE4U9C3_9ACTN|nr:MULTISPECIES: MlaD family protein [Gordonia]ATD72855.1 mammalian cell entry protein [Gordonia sp. 1D]MDJ0453274.1 MlaD family protein [Gordonia amicalis]MDV6309170.1 MlaD family protein [Gordonia amicalis]MDV6312198.1 MlaD family protein [Gordonia amicalis]MDV7076292.1 MlaD family protein [Gordonia amicalis]